MKIVDRRACLVNEQVTVVMYRFLYLGIIFTIDQSIGPGSDRTDLLSFINSTLLPSHSMDSVSNASLPIRIEHPFLDPDKMMDAIYLSAGESIQKLLEERSFPPVKLTSSELVEVIGVGGQSLVLLEQTLRANLAMP
ncbi:hypothetical protein HAX54_044124 [Datura stramonium]|uniref:Uncharacterized protein n=1 Tax=Datura stramonium TaxID=4076 RepID=A0ABS8W5Q7_DATST|nr:hypothetical protein [Datura stramonium]